ncbi:hypothetical protein EDB89DRAFT_2245763 [Lactarius sanguifluus]|nr:hypothetical protein EDB89DRAFT_2245763 [Lactarius sanguifluus]
MTLCRGAFGLSEPTWYIRLPPVSKDKGQYSMPRGGQGQAVSSGFKPASAKVLGAYKSYDLPGELTGMARRGATPGGLVAIGVSPASTALALRSHTHSRQPKRATPFEAPAALFRPHVVPISEVISLWDPSAIRRSDSSTGKVNRRAQMERQKDIIHSGIAPRHTFKFKLNLNVTANLKGFAEHPARAVVWLWVFLSAGCLSNVPLRSKAQYSAAPVGGPKPALKLRTDHVPSCPVLRLEFSTTPGLPLPPSCLYCRVTFGHWDGDSASYYEEYDHYTPPGPSRQSSQPRRLPSPLTPLASPSTFVQEFVQGSSTSGTQYEYTLADIHGEPPSGLPSPISRPATPLEYEGEAFPPLFDIRTQVAVRSVPLREPTPELVYPDPPSEPTPSPRPVSAPPRVPSPLARASTPPRVPTPDSPIDYERVAEQSPIDSTTTDLPSEWENILPASFFQPPSCINSPEEHPHLYTAVYSAEGESWRPASVTVREHFSRIPLAPALARAFPVFPSVTPFRIPPPHLYTIFPRLTNPANANDFPPLYICSKAILDSPSANLPLGSVRYDFREGLRQAFAPLSNILRAGYIDSLVTLEVQDFLDGLFSLPCPLNRVIQNNATMPPPHPGTFPLTEAQHVARARAQFDTHRDRQLRRYYPSTSYYDISESSRIDSWVDPPLVLKSLVNLFEFGETWDTYAFNDFQDDLSAVVDACNDQLLFWHLSDRTPEQLILWTKSDYLWFNHIPPRRDYLIQQLQAGNSVRYLDRFRLSYEEIEITFYEIRVVDREGPPSLVITEGTELTYSWERATWETTLNNPDHNLVNPRIYHEPPTDPNDPELVELLTARRTNPLSLLARLSLPASSPETEETNNSSNSGWGEEPNVGPCWCTQETRDSPYTRRRSTVVPWS